MEPPWSIVHDFTAHHITSLSHNSPAYCILLAAEPSSPAPVLPTHTSCCQKMLLPLVLLEERFVLHQIQIVYYLYLCLPFTHIWTDTPPIFIQYSFWDLVLRIVHFHWEVSRASHPSLYHIMPRVSLLTLLKGLYTRIKGPLTVLSSYTRNVDCNYIPTNHQSFLSSVLANICTIVWSNYNVQRVYIRLAQTLSGFILCENSDV